MATQTLARLTPAQVDAFWRDGYLTLSDFLSADDIATLRASMDSLERWVRNHEHQDFQREPKALHTQGLAIRKISHIHINGGAIWDELMRRDEVLDVMEDLMGPDIRFHHSKMMVKPPFEGSAKPWHQDLPEGFVTHEEADRLRPWGTDLQPEQVPVVAIQYYLDDSTLENGCIQVVPGSHRRGLFEDPLHESLIDQSEVVAAELKAGDALLFHCLTYHYSAPNTSPHGRRGVVYEYMAPATGVELSHDYGRDLGWGMPLRSPS